MKLAELLATYRPGSSGDEGWTWEKERYDIDDDRYRRLVADIAERGILVPVCIDEDERSVINGHHRVCAAIELGLDEVPATTEWKSTGAVDIEFTMHLDVAGDREGILDEVFRIVADAIAGFRTSRGAWVSLECFSGKLVEETE